MSWTFLSNHSHVLVCIARNPEVLLRDVAGQVGITERAVQRIVSDLEQAGYLTRGRSGRRNHYTIDRTLPLRHPLEAHRTIGALLDGVDPDDSAASGIQPAELHSSESDRGLAGASTTSPVTMTVHTGTVHTGE